MNIHPVILSGGSGTRLWPMSRASMPKQFLGLASELSLLQETALRAMATCDCAPTFVCNEEHRFLLAEQMRTVGVNARAIVLEPMGRNTAPAVTVAALSILDADPDAVLMVMPSDHVVRDVPAFTAAVQSAAVAAMQGHLVTFGIKPDHPETGYGYIQAGPQLDGCPDCYSTAAFLEKPALPDAKNYVACSDYYWNSGMFVFQARAYLDEMKRLCPQIYELSEKALRKGSRDHDFLRLDVESFKTCPADSIDYAVMEKTERGAVIPVDMSWSDVGSWSALWDIKEKSAGDNVLCGDVFTEDTANTYISAESRFVAAVGVDELIIIETVDAVLVARKDKVQHVKQVVEHLKSHGRAEHASHRRVCRPWGSYESVDHGDRFQVKRITVKPGAKLSLQMHHHRAEHWVVVRGTARVTRGGEQLLISENESTYIPLGVSHRLENPGKVPLEIIEVQSGAYLGEDDIVRLEDAYGRA
ncbi:MAG: mannose-1-phosphate guanylyltransferase/mannose-6-phosphate isomerase [Pseudomonadota bacterium]